LLTSELLSMSGRLAIPVISTLSSIFESRRRTGGASVCDHQRGLAHGYQRGNTDCQGIEGPAVLSHADWSLFGIAQDVSSYAP
jgi:hypothetical protein